MIIIVRRVISITDCAAMAARTWSSDRELTKKGKGKKYRKKLHRKRKRKRNKWDEHAFSCLLRLSCSLFLSHAIILAEILVSLCNMHPDLNDMWKKETKERTRKTKKVRKKRRDGDKVKGKKSKKTRYWKSLSQTTSQLCNVYVMSAHMLLIVRYCQDGLSYVWNYNIINMCPRAYSANVSAKNVYARRYIWHIGIDIYISIYIYIYVMYIYIYIFTGESHMKASQGHDMRRAN